MVLRFDSPAYSICKPHNGPLNTVVYSPICKPHNGPLNTAHCTALSASLIMGLSILALMREYKEYKQKNVVGAPFKIQDKC